MESTALQDPSVSKIETPISFIWKESDIIYSEVKNDYDPNCYNSNKLTFDAMENLAGGEKKALLAITGKLKSSNKEIRHYGASRLEKLFWATAYVTPNALSRMVMNIFVGSTNVNYPIKFFSNVNDAKAWIQQLK